MITPAQTAAVTVAPKREIRVVEDDSPLSYIMDTAKFEHCYRIAEAMSRASLIPPHLKGGTKEETAANCFLVVNQALRWHMDPFLIAPETYAIGGKLGYQGKLVAAVINTRAGLAEKLSYVFNDKKGDEFAVTVSGRFEDEAEPRTVTVSVGQAKTQNPMWVKDPEQKLVYTGSIKWARRHKPEIIMGVVTDDDLDAVREQVAIDNMKLVKTPQIETMAAMPPVTEPTEPKKKRDSKGRPTLVESPLDPPAPVVEAQPADQTQAAPPASQVLDAVPPTSTIPEAPEGELLRLAAKDGVNPEQLLKFLFAEHFMKPPKTKITELSTKMLGQICEFWKTQPSFVKKAQSTQ